MERDRAALETAKDDPLYPSSPAGLGGGRVSLLVFHREGAEIVALEPGEPVVVGRAPPSTIVLNDLNLSRQHARFVLLDGHILVEDLGSTNGTLVAGERVERARLRPGDEVLLGSVTVSAHELSGDRGAGRGLAGHDRFLSAAEHEVDRARYFGRAVSVLMIQAERATAPTTAARHVRFWCARLQSMLRPVDRVGIYSDETLEILLPEADAEAAERVARDILGEHEKMPALVCGIAAYPEAAASAQELIERSRQAAQHATSARPIARADAKLVSDPHGGAAVDPLASKSRLVRAALATAARAAKGAVPILLVGETGSGKEVFAQYIHDTGPRSARTMLRVNCGAIPAQLVESTLFGHEKGAFTGALQQHRGVFEAADGGTVFLDEIGELPLPVQVALLRVLETKSFTRVGSTAEVRVDVRVVAATHRDLEAMVKSGSFREDLWYRLNTIVLRVPALRERREDLPDLARIFLAAAREANGGGASRIDPDALALFDAYAWPGNVRELKNVIERAMVIANGPEITVDDLPERLRAAAPIAEPKRERARASLDVAAVAREDDDFRTKMDRIEAALLSEVLELCNWNQSAAARRLSMPLRTLQHKIKELSIRRPA